MAAAPNPLDDDALVTQLGGTPKPKPFGGASNEDVLKTAYQQYTGREADASGLAAHLKNPGGIQGGLQAIANSPEAMGYKRAGGTGYDPLAATPPTSNTMPVREGAAATTPAVVDPGRRGWNNLSLDTPTQRNINAFSGFNADRALAGSDDDSVKDAFQRWAGGLDFNLKGKTKDQIGDFYKSQLQSAKDYGLDIRDVQGEKILINTKERGPEWIDSVIGAGGDNPMFGWQSEYDTQGDAALGPRTSPSTSTANTALTNVIAGQGGEKTARQKLLDEIAAMVQGSASPVDNNALLDQLQA